MKGSTRCPVCGAEESNVRYRSTVRAIHYECGLILCDDVPNGFIMPCKNGRFVDRIVTLEAEVSALKQKNMALEAQLDYVSIECPDCGGIGVLGLAKDGRWVPCETCGGHDERPGFGRVPHG